MFVKIFKKKYTLQLFILAIVPIIFWSQAFINPPEVMTNKFDMPLYKVIYDFTKDYQLFSTIAAFAMVFLQGLLLNQLFTNNHLSQKNTFLPAFIYILLMSCSYKCMTLNSMLFSNFLIIFALYFFLKCHDKKEGIDEIYNSCTLLSIASLFFAPAIIFILWIWLGLIIYKLYKWRSWGMSILGIITPYVLLFIFYYLNGMSFQENILADTNKWLHFDFLFLDEPIQVVYIASLLFFAIPAIFTTLSSRSNRVIEYRKKSAVMFTLLIISLVPFFLSKTEYNMSFIFAITLSFFFSNFFLQYHNERKINTFFIIFILISIIKVFFPH
ncbi:MAG: hypothetical protein IKV46_06465 [Bacteroidales bacterium]|nr:hypothetical protein [Bacteroidales bacterium]